MSNIFERNISYRDSYLEDTVAISTNVKTKDKVFKNPKRLSARNIEEENENDVGNNSITSFDSNFTNNQAKEPRTTKRSKSHVTFSNENILESENIRNTDSEEIFVAAKSINSFYSTVDDDSDEENEKNERNGEEELASLPSPISETIFEKKKEKYFDFFEVKKKIFFFFSFF
jgi:hypothetical protein